MSTNVSTQLISREELLSLATEILMKWNTSEIFARSISESLVQAQEAGHASHGVIRLLEYTQLIDKKVIVPDIQPTIKSEFNAFSSPFKCDRRFLIALIHTAKI